MCYQSGKGELGTVERACDLVCFRVLDRAGPDKDIVLRVAEVCLHICGEEGATHERGCVVVLRGDEKGEQELRVVLRSVPRTGIAALVKGKSMFAVFLLEFTGKASSCVAAREGPTTRGVVPCT